MLNLSPHHTGTPKERVERRVAAGMAHPMSMCNGCAARPRHGGVFLHERPRGAASWKSGPIQRPPRWRDGHATRCEQCMCGAQEDIGTGWSVSAGKRARVLKPTRSEGIAIPML